ncbi:uncharacterized protein LOC111643380 [Copidosoma floridanum]|uniref:uncharacterized protein LOC111643380 n=1 Tax=Copidosoma floridanum TaxID=29053 RepID=UPI000C6FA598|nr:uncharacterized protein LOC111643380 [Copidosoma floridanum]
MIHLAGARSQENAVKTLPSALFECYDDETHKGWNQLPHNIKILIEIIRKIEDHSAQHVNLLDMRYLSTAILHRFRQDGIVRNPHVKAREGILPYAPLGKQFFRHAQTLRVIPGNAFNFPNDSLTPIERCTLHSMLSSSIDIFERGDESRTCRFANYAFRRFGRSTDERNVKEDVETLTAEQIDLMTGKSGRDVVDPNSLYPAYPRNHPSSERLVNTPPLSKCPIENGVVQTPWGTVSGGSVIAGIATGLEPMMTRIDDLMKQQVEPRVSDYASDVVIDNKFLATLSGDLAEVALKQGPQIQGNRYVVGVEGNWNSTTKPLFYFLNSNENLEMTGAEIRGDIDGLILANRVLQYYEKSRNLRLSQVLDMYYGERGFFDRNVRACKRREHFVTVAPTDTLKSQTLSAVILLNPDIGTATFSYETVERFVKQAVDDLGTHIPTMNRDESCDSRSDSSSMSNLISETAANLTIVIDTTWPFDSVNKILSQLLLSGQLDVNKYNSQYTLVNAATGSVMFNSSHTPLTTQNFNQTFYNSR